MADVNDPSGIARKLQRQWELLDEASIDDRDRAAIESFVNHRREIEGVSRNTRTRDLSTLRCATERADVALVAMELADVRSLFRVLTSPDGYDLDREGSAMFGYKRALRLFFRFLDDEPDYGSYPFHDRIELPTWDVKGATSEDEMLTADEVEALKRAAEFPRDRAIIAFLADMALRATALLSMRRGDIHLDGPEPWFEPNDEMVDGLKGFDSEPPILYSRAELRSFVHDHHPDDRPEAPLWPLLGGRYDYDDPQGSALGDDRLRDMLREVGERAGLEKPVEPHHFRRVALTRMSNSDRLTPQEITHIAGWADERMLEVYDYTTAAERNSNIHQATGFSDGGEDVAAPSGPTPCLTCGEQLAPSTRFCPRCGHPATKEAVVSRDAARGELADEMASSDRARKRAALRELLGMVDRDPSLLDEVELPAHE